jgi:ubiquinone/menaquinone biosynthesis C-methylase UbiE
MINVPEPMDYYDTIAHGYNELHYEEQMNKLRIISNSISVMPHERLLDIGCGPGFSKEVFNCRIIGLEPSKEMIFQGKDEDKHKMDFLQGIGEHLPFSDNSFDHVICVTALHNFNDPERGLLEIKRVGKGKGAITILKKAKYAKNLRDLMNKFFTIKKEIEEEKDIILFFGLDK